MSHWFAVTLIAVVVLAFLYWRLVYFLRDPARTPPPGEGMLSAADGYVVYVRRVEAGSVPIAVKLQRAIPLVELLGRGATTEHAGESGFLIGTFLTVLSVHRNRIPLSGTVVYREHFHAPRNLTMVRMMTNLIFRRTPPEADCLHLLTNERLTLGIRTEKGTYAVTQIADKWINRIVAHPSAGDRVERGEQYGLIRFGSQVDVFIPDSLGLRPIVESGQYVRGGLSIIAE